MPNKIKDEKPVPERSKKYRGWGAEGGARPGTGPKSYIPNPRRKTFTLPGDHFKELTAKIQALIDEYRIKK